MKDINSIIDKYIDLQFFELFNMYYKMKEGNLTTMPAPDGYEITLKDQGNNNEDFIG